MGVAQTKWWVRNRAPQTPEKEVALEDLKKDELVAKAEEAGVDSSGTKAEIIERLSDG